MVEITEILLLKALRILTYTHSYVLEMELPTDPIPALKNADPNYGRTTVEIANFARKTLALSRPVRRFESRTCCRLEKMGGTQAVKTI